MRAWFTDHGLRSIAKNASLLALSKAFSALATLMTMALAARALGATQIGWVLLIHSYAMAASSLTHFQSWQVIVRYGSRGLANGEPSAFKKATSFAMGLDFASGLFGMALAMILLPRLAASFQIPAALTSYAIAYCFLIPMMGSAAANGILRALDRFDLISWQGPLQAYPRLLLIAVAFYFDLPVYWYIGFWFVSDLLGDLYLWLVAIRELKRRFLLHGIRPTLKSGGLEKAWRFAITVNLTASVNSAWGPVARLLVGAILSPAATSLYRVATSLADAAQAPIDLLSKAVHPELMRHDPSSKRPWKLMLRTIALSAMVSLSGWLLIVLFGERLLSFAFGPEFAPAYSLLTVLMILPVLATVSFPMPAMFYSVDKASGPFFANALGAAAFLGTMPWLAERFGLLGAGLALVLGKALTITVMSIALVRLYRAVRPRRGVRPAT